MKISEMLKSCKSTAFSFELLPPLKGNSLESLTNTIDKLKEFNPKYINITTHRSEVFYRDMGNGLFKAENIRRRPGAVAVAAAIQQRYGIPVVPHIHCSGFTREETEYVLLDLQFLGINNLFLLRGDKAKNEKTYKPVEGGNAHATDLEEQVNRYNEGYFINGDKVNYIGEKFDYGVACYPEKHEEAPNMETDLAWFKRKAELGAGYAVTQMFLDNEKYYRFVESAKNAGINIPIIPGIKPLTKLSQLTVLPKTFHCDIPNELTVEIQKCKSDDEVRELGVEWCTAQCKDLIKHGVPSIHFYALSAADSVKRVAEAIY